ncbi:MAG: serine hydrolase domain-containing protein [Cyclobacteriaceae bacterium]
MKNLLIISGILLAGVILFSCNNVTESPEYYSCQSFRADSSASHPKAMEFQSLIDQKIKMGIPGMSIYIKTEDGHTWSGSSGLADLENRIAMETCHPMLVASVSKVFTATNVMKLQQEGILALDDLLAEHLEGEFMDEIKNAKKVTVRQLLDHTSGLFDYLDPLAYDLNSANKPYSHDSPQKKLKFAYGKSPNNAPGEKYYYSNTNFVLLALMVEQKTGKSLPQNRKEVIFNPLGLTSAFAGTTQNPIPTGTPQGYFSLHGNNVLQNSEYWYHNDLATGDGDIAINMTELGYFLQMLFTGQLLDQTTVDLMVDSDELPEDWKGFYHDSNGLGVEVYETPYGTAYGHTGAILGFLTLGWYFPESGATLTFAVNALSPKILEVREKFADEIMEVMFEK